MTSNLTWIISQYICSLKSKIYSYTGENSVRYRHRSGHSFTFFLKLHDTCKVQSAGAVVYTDCISAEGWDIPNECPKYDNKPSDGEAPALKLREIWSILSLPLLLDPLYPGVEIPDGVLFMGQIELFDI